MVTTVGKGGTHEEQTVFVALHETLLVPKSKLSAQMQTGINRVGIPGGVKSRQVSRRAARAFYRIDMSWSIPFRSCPIYIDRAVIVINKPPGVVCQLRDDRVFHHSTALVYRRRRTDGNTASSAMGIVSTS